MQTPMLFTACYTRGDDLAAFEYEVELADTPSHTAWVWVVRVMSNGVFRSRLTGVMPGTSIDDPTMEAKLRKIIEASLQESSIA